MQAEQLFDTKQVRNSSGAVTASALSMNGHFDCGERMFAQANAMPQGMFHAPSTHAGAAACRHSAARVVCCCYYINHVATHPFYLPLLYEMPELGVCHFPEPVYSPHGLGQASLLVYRYAGRIRNP